MISKYHRDYSRVESIHKQLLHKNSSKIQMCFLSIYRVHSNGSIIRQFFVLVLLNSCLKSEPFHVKSYQRLYQCFHQMTS